MPSKVAGTTVPTDAMARRLAVWIKDFGASAISSKAADRVRAILLDSIGCALAASIDEKAGPVFRALPQIGGTSDCTIIGSDMRSSLPAASFGNSALIRLLDLNDTYTGPRQLGHPGFLMVPNCLGVEGGVPILFEDECLGGVGVSGIDYDDERVAQAGCDAFTK